MSHSCGHPLSQMLDNLGHIRQAQEAIRTYQNRFYQVAIDYAADASSDADFRTGQSLTWTANTLKLKVLDDLAASLRNTEARESAKQEEAHQRESDKAQEHWRRSWAEQLRREEQQRQQEAEEWQRHHEQMREDYGNQRREDWNQWGGWIDEETREWTNPEEEYRRQSAYDWEREFERSCEEWQRQWDQEEYQRQFERDWGNRETVETYSREDESDYEDLYDTTQMEGIGGGDLTDLTMPGDTEDQCEAPGQKKPFKPGQTSRTSDATVQAGTMSTAKPTVPTSLQAETKDTATQPTSSSPHQHNHHSNVDEFAKNAIHSLNVNAARGVANMTHHPASCNESTADHSTAASAARRGIAKPATKKVKSEQPAKDERSLWFE